MNKLIYDIRKNKHLQNIIDGREPYFSKPFYVVDYGRYGTDKWWDNIEKAGLINVLHGIITKVIPSDKGSIPQIEVKAEEELLVFNAEGDDGIYPVGGVVKLYFVKNNDVFVEKVGGNSIIRAEILE